MYKLARKKQSLSPPRNLDQDSSMEYVYKGNYQDLDPFFKRDGKYRMTANLSQVQYAAALRNYHPVDYHKIPERLDRAKEKKGKLLTRNLSALNSFEEETASREADVANSMLNSVELE